MRFAIGQGAGQVVMDAKAEAGGKGEAPTPKEMVLQGLAGCTGLDVAAILGKKKVEFENLELEVSAEQTASHPKVFKKIHVIYRITCAEEDRVHVERAIELSKNQFCGVSAMLAKSAELTWELDLKPKA
jgi:putative redox protein